MATTFGDRKAAGPPRKGKLKKRRRKDENEEGVFEDVVALDIPRRVIATFEVNVQIKDLPRLKPTIIFEPGDGEE